MVIVKVIYTAKAEYVVQNQTNIKQVMADLQALNNTGINYNACLGADGKTFIHTAFFKSDDERKTLNEMLSFIHFQQQLKAEGIEVPPKQELLQLVGSSINIFD